MKNNMQHTEYTCHHRTLSWTAVLSGAFIALGLGFLLQLFSVAIGLSAYHTSSSGTTMAMGGLLGLMIGAIASMGAAGFVSGYLGRFRTYCSSEALIYGFLTWSMALFLTSLLLIPLTQYVSHYRDSISSKVTVSERFSKNLEVTQKATTSSANDEEAINRAQPEVKVTPMALTSSSWALFLLFFIGAISSCIGAYCGMECGKKHRHDVPTTHHL